MHATGKKKLSAHSESDCGLLISSSPYEWVYMDLKQQSSLWKATKMDKLLSSHTNHFLTHHQLLETSGHTHLSDLYGWNNIFSYKDLLWNSEYMYLLWSFCGSIQTTTLLDVVHVIDGNTHIPAAATEFQCKSAIFHREGDYKSYTWHILAGRANPAVLLGSQSHRGISMVHYVLV